MDDIITGIVYWNMAVDDVMVAVNSVVKKHPDIIPPAINCKDTFEVNISVRSDRTIDFITIQSTSAENAKKVKFTTYDSSVLVAFLKQHQWQSTITLRNNVNVGAKILTLPMGNWEGGECIITEIPEDEEFEHDNISLIVNRVSDGEEMGIFNNELVRVTESTFA